MAGTYLDQLTALARAKVTGAGVRVYLKTNLGPAVPLYTGSTGEPGLLSSLGVKGGVIVTDAQGNTLARYGEPVATDPLKAGLILGALGLVGFIVLRGILK